MGTTTMIETSQQLRLMAWLSPAFPTGAFAFSAGLEAAVHADLVRDRTTLAKWIKTSLVQGTLHLDGGILVRAHDVAAGDSFETAQLDSINDLALALCSSHLRYEETVSQGAAFFAAWQAWTKQSSTKPFTQLALPVAVGLATGTGALNRLASISAFLHAGASNQIQAAIRLNLFGQMDAAGLLADLEAHILQAAEGICEASDRELSTCAPTADIVAMSHETLDGRLFLS